MTTPGTVDVAALGTSKVNFRLATGLNFGNAVDAAAGGFCCVAEGRSAEEIWDAFFAVIRILGEMRVVFEVLL